MKSSIPGVRRIMAAIGSSSKSPRPFPPIPCPCPAFVFLSSSPFPCPTLPHSGRYLLSQPWFVAYFVQRRSIFLTSYSPRHPNSLRGLWTGWSIFCGLHAFFYIYSMKHSCVVSLGLPWHDGARIRYDLRLDKFVHHSQHTLARIHEAKPSSLFCLTHRI